MEYYSHTWLKQAPFLQHKLRVIICQSTTVTGSERPFQRELVLREVISRDRDREGGERVGGGGEGRGGGGGGGKRREKTLRT